MKNASLIGGAGYIGPVLAHELTPRLVQEGKPIHLLNDCV